MGPKKKPVKAQEDSNEEQPEPEPKSRHPASKVPKHKTPTTSKSKLKSTHKLKAPLRGPKAKHTEDPPEDNDQEDGQSPAEHKHYHHHIHSHHHTDNLTTDDINAPKGRKAPHKPQADGGLHDLDHEPGYDNDDEHDPDHEEPTDHEHDPEHDPEHLGDEVVNDPHNDDTRNVWSVEAFQPTADRRYQNKLANSLGPFIFFAFVFGKFPLSYTFRKDGSIQYRFVWKSLQAISFIIGSTIVLLLTVWTVLAALSMVTNIPVRDVVRGGYGKWVRSHELFMIKRNLVPLLIFLFHISHLLFGHVLIFDRRDYLCRYFSYWAETAELLRLDCALDVYKDLLKRVLMLMLMMGLLIVMHFIDCFQICDGAGATIAIITFRLYDPEIAVREDFHFFKVTGSLIFIYVFVTHKFFMLYFWYRCRLIVNMITVWNRRFETCMLGEPGATKKMMRSTRAYLFKDHMVCLNLIEGANHEWSWIVESYMATAMGAMIVEAYHVVRSVSAPEFDANRQLDFFAALLYFLFDVYSFITATLEAGRIAEQIVLAFEILKQKGMMTKKADQELWFMLSMQLSLQGCSGEPGIGINGCDFIYITKLCMVLCAGVMLSFFIMFWQFQMPLDQNPVSDPTCYRIDVQAFLKRVEGTSQVWPDKETYPSACNKSYLNF